MSRLCKTDTMTYTSCFEVPWKTALQVIHWMVMAAWIMSPLASITFKNTRLPSPHLIPTHITECPSHRNHSTSGAFAGQKTHGIRLQLGLVTLPRSALGIPLSLGLRLGTLQIWGTSASIQILFGNYKVKAEMASNRLAIDSRYPFWLVVFLSIDDYTGMWTNRSGQTPFGVKEAQTRVQRGFRWKKKINKKGTKASK